MELTRIKKVTTIVRPDGTLTTMDYYALVPKVRWEQKWNETWDGPAEDIMMTGDE